MALADNGDVWVWGANHHGQCGLGGSASQHIYVPTLLSTLPPRLRVVQLAAGEAHSVLISEDGRVWTWGANNLGQLGTGEASTTAVMEPRWVHLLNGTVAVHAAAGKNHTFITTVDSASAVPPLRLKGRGPDFLCLDWDTSDFGSATVTYSLEMSEDCRLWRKIPPSSSFTTKVSALNPGQVYYFRLCCTSEESLEYGDTYCWCTRTPPRSSFLPGSSSLFDESNTIFNEFSDVADEPAQAIADRVRLVLEGFGEDPIVSQMLQVLEVYEVIIAHLENRRSASGTGAVHGSSSGSAKPWSRRLRLFREQSPEDDFHRLAVELKGFENTLLKDATELLRYQRVISEQVEIMKQELTEIRTSPLILHAREQLQRIHTCLQTDPVVKEHGLPLEVSMEVDAVAKALFATHQGMCVPDLSSDPSALSASDYHVITQEQLRQITQFSEAVEKYLSKGTSVGNGSSGGKGKGKAGRAKKKGRASSSSAQPSTHAGRGPGGAVRAPSVNEQLAKCCDLELMFQEEVSRREEAIQRCELEMARRSQRLCEELGAHCVRLKGLIKEVSGIHQGDKSSARSLLSLAASSTAGHS